MPSFDGRWGLSCLVIASRIIGGKTSIANPHLSEIAARRLRARAPLGSLREGTARRRRPPCGRGLTALTATRPESAGIGHIAGSFAEIDYGERAVCWDWAQCEPVCSNQPQCKLNCRLSL